jgi:hypothetical protein
LSYSNELCKNDIIKIILDKNTSKNINLCTSIVNKYNNVNIKIEDIISSNQILIEPITTNNSNVFVFGKLVNDFHTLEYQSIFALNVEVTQELHKSNIAKMAEVSNLMLKIENNNSNINKYKSITSNLFERIALLEAKII